MSIPIHIITIEATNEDGDYVQVKLEGLTEVPSEEDVAKAKKATADLFEWGFGEEPYEVHVRDSMKHRAERDGEDDSEGSIIHLDDGDRYGVEFNAGRQFIIDAQDNNRRVYEVVDINAGDTATAGVAAYRLNEHGEPGASAPNLREVTA